MQGSPLASVAAAVIEEVSSIIAEGFRCGRDLSTELSKLIRW